VLTAGVAAGIGALGAACAARSAAFGLVIIVNTCFLPV
jgi:phosphoglycerate dehydrogenase-like enzyme